MDRLNSQMDLRNLNKKLFFNNTTEDEIQKVLLDFLNIDNFNNLDINWWDVKVFFDLLQKVRTKSVDIQVLSDRISSQIIMDNLQQSENCQKNVSLDNSCCKDKEEYPEESKVEIETVIETDAKNDDDKTSAKGVKEENSILFKKAFLKNIKKLDKNIFPEPPIFPEEKDSIVVSMIDNITFPGNEYSLKVVIDRDYNVLDVEGTPIPILGRDEIDAIYDGPIGRLFKYQQAVKDLD